MINTYIHVWYVWVRVCVHIIHTKENGSQRPPFWWQSRLPGFERWRPYLGENDCHLIYIYILGQKIVQRNQESIRNHLGNFETIGSWLKVLPTYWLCWESGSLLDGEPTSSLSSRLANFFEGPFYICPYNSVYCFHWSSDWGSGIQIPFFEAIAHLPRN